MPAAKKARSEGKQPRYASAEVCFAACEAHKNADSDKKDEELVKLAARYKRDVGTIQRWIKRGSEHYAELIASANANTRNRKPTAVRAAFATYVGNTLKECNYSISTTNLLTKCITYCRENDIEWIPDTIQRRMNAACTALNVTTRRFLAVASDGTKLPLQFVVAGTPAHELKNSRQKNTVVSRFANDPFVHVQPKAWCDERVARDVWVRWRMDGHLKENMVVVFDNFGAHRIWQVEAARKSHSWDPATSCVWGGPYIPKARPDATDGTDPFDPPDHAPTHLWQVGYLRGDGKKNHWVLADHGHPTNPDDLPPTPQPNVFHWDKRESPDSDSDDEEVPAAPQQAQAPAPVVAQVIDDDESDEEDTAMVLPPGLNLALDGTVQAPVAQGTLNAAARALLAGDDKERTDLTVYSARLERHGATSLEGLHFLASPTNTVAARSIFDNGFHLSAFYDRIYPMKGRKVTAPQACLNAVQALIAAPKPK